MIPSGAIKELEQHIANNKLKTLTPNDVRQEFCSAWPAARAGLEELQKVLNLVPGVTTYAESALSLVLAAGDAAKGALCKGS
jgi:hypothetical protein